MTAESLSSRMRSPEQLLAGLGIAALAGLGSGLASAVFLAALDAVTATRWRHPWLLFLLPVAGLLMVRAYATWGRGSERGVSLLLDVAHRREQVVWI